MLWGAWYTGVRFHSPFSQEWLGLVFRAPEPLWFVLSIMGICSFVTMGEYSKRRRLNDRIEASVDLKRSWDANARQHDQSLFERTDGILQEALLIGILQRLQSDDSYIRSQMQQLRTFRQVFLEVGNSYIDDATSRKLAVLIEAIDELLNFIGKNFFVYPDNQAYGDQLQFCLYPRLNVDRDGDGTPEATAKYDLFGEQLSSVATRVQDAYSDYRRAVKLYLYI